MPIKKISTLLVALMLSNSPILAQAGDFLNVTVVIKDKDNKQSLKLVNDYDLNKEILGYIAFPNFTNVIYGSLNKDFSFLGDKVFGGNVNFLLPKWAANKFPIDNIEPMTDGCDVSKVFTFGIKMYKSKTNNDSITLAMKFAVIDRKNPGSRELNNDYNVTFFYKLIHTTLGSNITPDFIRQFFPGYEITFNIEKKTAKSQMLVVDNVIYDEIKKSLREVYLDKTTFDFMIQHGVSYYDENDIFWYDTKFHSNNQQNGLEKKYVIRTVNGFDSLKLAQPIYYSRLEFPFQLLNLEKAKNYEGYRSKNTVFNSKYEFILIPIETNDDTLTVDVIAIYNKLSLDDSAPRWSPFKKRLKVLPTYGNIIKLPKENWSAVFTRNNEQYEIYGYSDYEKFVNEQIYIELEKIYKEK